MKIDKDKASTNSAQALDTIVVIPTFNEEMYIQSILEILLSDSSCERFDIWILDADSVDRTRDIAKTIAKENRKVKLIANPNKSQAFAINIAANLAKKTDGVKYIIRADAHIVYPKDFITKLLSTAEETSAESVVVPMTTIGGNTFQNMSADLFNSWLGTGGSAHRSGRIRGFVEHGHHALFRLNEFHAVTGYDPYFIANEDAEFDIRFRNEGYRIFLDNENSIKYIPRENVRDLWRQYFRNGYYRVRTAIKHKRVLGPRQLAPILVTQGLILSVVFGVLVDSKFFLAALAYFTTVLLLASIYSEKDRTSHAIGIGWLAVVTHTAFGVGALSSIMNWLVETVLGSIQRLNYN